MTTRIVSKVLICSAMGILSLSISVTSARAQQDKPPETSAASRSGADQKTDDRGKEQNAPIPEDINPKNDRIFKVIPNYTTVEIPIKYTPLSVKEKFKLGAEDAFDPYAFPLAAILAGIAQAQDEDAAWGQGLKGYGKRYAAGFGDATIGSFMTTGLFPSMLHEDPRYFRLGTGGFWRRSGHAVDRLLVIRTDSDHSQFNVSLQTRTHFLNVWEQLGNADSH